MVNNNHLLTQLQKFVDLIERQETLLEKIEKITNIGHWYWDIKNDEITWSDEIFRILDIDSSECLSFENFLEMIHPEDRERVDKSINESFENNYPFFIRYRVIQKNKNILYLESSGEVTCNKGIPLYFIGIIKDVTFETKKEEELRRLALRDSGTNLYNKRFFMEQMDVTIDNSLRNKTPIGMLLIDLDDFGKVNNTYGHLFGDKLIVEIANRITQVFTRKTDIVARYGGDEFVVLCTNITLGDIEKKCNELTTLLNMSTTIDNINIIQTASIGLCYSEQGNNITTDKIIQEADMAMYKVKMQNKNSTEITVCTL